ncbi:MAG: GNAT family N-acetyltransferase [Chloroflexi bacterium]|nr:GNAT family N-acetyltransferase [Chloroflexota bacterium]
MTVLREVRDEELAAVLALWREAYGTVGTTDSLGDVLQAASGSTSVLLVAEEEGRIVGTVIGGFDGWRGNIYRLAVHPEHHRQGIARRLVSDMEGRLSEMGARRITALVERDHPWATGFWDAAGYGLDAGTARYVRNF